MKTIDDIDKTNVPRHVAVIMDGNGRWAQRQSEIRLYGHQHAIQAVRDTVEAAARLQIDYLTLYTFSTENWNRPKDEVDGLMQLMIKAVEDETETLLKNNVRLLVIGDIDRVPETSRKSVLKCCADTAANTGTTLVMALSYSSRWEIGKALRSMAANVVEGTLKPENIDEETLRKYLETKDMPDPDLLIRTGGELRVSNFLLWQMAYTEFYFTDILWPDFRMGDFYEAVFQFQNRQRRYGKTGDQVKK